MSAHMAAQGAAPDDSATRDGAPPGAAPTAGAPAGPDPAGPEPAGTGPHGGEAALAAHIASVERGRIAAMGGVVNLIWLVILVLMVWQP
jgi:hypothetical protein